MKWFLILLCQFQSCFQGMIEKHSLVCYVLDKYMKKLQICCVLFWRIGRYSVIFVASYLKRLLCIKRFSFQQMTLLWSSSFCCLLQRLNDDYRTIIITFVIFPSLTMHPTPSSNKWTEHDMVLNGKRFTVLT